MIIEQFEDQEWSSMMITKGHPNKSNMSPNPASFRFSFPTISPPRKKREIFSFFFFRVKKKAKNDYSQKLSMDSFRLEAGRLMVSLKFGTTSNFVFAIAMYSGSTPNYGPFSIHLRKKRKRSSVRCERPSTRDGI